MDFVDIDVLHLFGIKQVERMGHTAHITGDRGDQKRYAVPDRTTRLAKPQRPGKSKSDRRLASPFRFATHAKKARI